MASYHEAFNHEGDQLDRLRRELFGEVQKLVREKMTEALADNSVTKASAQDTRMACASLIIQITADGSPVEDVIRAAGKLAAFVISGPGEAS